MLSLQVNFHLALRTAAEILKKSEILKNQKF